MSRQVDTGQAKGLRDAARQARALATQTERERWWIRKAVLLAFADGLDEQAGAIEARIEARRQQSTVKG